MVGPAGGATDGVGVRGAPDQLFELGSAIVALVFEDRHVFILEQQGERGLGCHGRKAG